MNGFSAKVLRSGSAVVFFLIALTALFFAAGWDHDRNSGVPRAENGILDLTDWDFEQDGVLPLNGQWEFVWQPEGEAAAHSYMTVPATWGGAELANGLKLRDQGKGVYRLTILHRPVEDMLAIRLPNISTSMRLFVDGKPLLSRGQPGSDKASTVPYQLPATVYFGGENERTELTLEVANFHHRTGGIRSELAMGTAEQIHRLEFKQTAQEWIVFGCLVMIGLYHLGLFALRRRETANLFFGLLCLFVACRMGVIGSGLFMEMHAGLTWTLAARLEYTAFILSGLFGFLYYQRMYPQEISRGLSRLAVAAGLGLTALTWLLPVLQSSSVVWLYQAYVVLLSLATIAALVAAASRKREGAWLSLIGVAGLVATILNDILIYNGWLRSFDLVAFGLLFLVMMNSFGISLRLSRTYERAEQMSVELREWNNRLEERIAERTEQLRRSYRDLERMEQSRRHLISNISHDLKTPITLLQGYLEALRDGIIADEEQKNKIIRSMLNKVEGLNNLIHDLFELSILEARKAPMSFMPVKLANWHKRLTEEYELELKNRGLRFHTWLDTGGDGNAWVRIDEHRMDRVFSNLIYNAVRYTPPGGEIELGFQVTGDRKQAVLSVADTGCGIPPDDLPHIFERYYRNDKSRKSSEAGSGLGLSIAREIVEMHDGRITAENRPEGGSVFRIYLPLGTSDGGNGGL